MPDPSISKRVCFYKSGDTQFSGHRMIINARTFKTFDALLDALSKKVPLPFGVRTITTPRGTHPVKGLEDLHDGGSYVCSDTKRVKPLNMEAVSRRQVPWNTARPVSAGRRARRGRVTPSLGRRSKAERVSRPSRAAFNRAAVRTPKRLVVYRNKDPNIKRTVVLQRKTAPTFEALLDYLSQVMQFPVLKLYSADGRRVDGLATLVLCSGVIVAAGNEPFRPRNNHILKAAQGAQSDHSDPVEPSKLHALSQTKKSFSSGRGSRNFSLSSERHIVNQIKQSLSGSSNSPQHHRNSTSETELNRHRESTDTEGRGQARAGDRLSESIVPKDDDIEKSFRVNQDGSMTVEMKVRLTIKEEEMLHWTTTLSRSSLTQSSHTVCASKSGSGNNSPDSNNVELSTVIEDEPKEENHHGDNERAAAFREEGKCNGVSPLDTPQPRSGNKRKPTPGPRHVKKKTSVESVKTLTESGVEETTLGRFSYLEKTVDGEITEEYCEVRQSSSRSRHVPVPLPRKTRSAGAVRNRASLSFPGVAEVLQIQSNGMEITETVMHIYETQGCYDNYVGNALPTRDQRSKPPSTESGPRSSDCDVDFSRLSTTTDSQNGRRDEILSLSSEPPRPEISNNLSSLTDNEAHTAADSQTESSPKETGSAKIDSTSKGDKKKKAVKAKAQPKSSTSTTSSDKKLKESVRGSSKSSKQTPSPEKQSSSGKKNGSGTDSEKTSQKRAEKAQSKKKVSGDELTPSKNKAMALNIENIKGVMSKKQLNLNGKAAMENGHNVNTPETAAARPLQKKNMLDILPPKQLTLKNKKIITKQKSMNEKRTTTPKQKLDLSESVSMPALNDMPSDVHQYVENWLQKINPNSDPPPYMEEAVIVEPEPDPEPKTKVVFQLGDDSESEVKDELSPSHLDEHEEENRSLLCEDDAAKSRSFSCLSVPVSYEGPSTESGMLKPRGLCSSMPSVRIDPVEQESRLRMHKSVEAIGPVETSEVSYTSNLLSPKERLKPVIQQLCSSLQGIRRIPEPHRPSGIEKSRSLPDISSHVSSVFGSPSRALLSFLSAVTLRDSFTGSEAGDCYEGESRDPPEALLVMESLQKISAIKDEEEQRASLTDLQGRTSSQLQERWRDFQARRERLESEPVSPKFSETEFALDVMSEGGDGPDDQQVVIEELMEELNLPPELREGLTSLVDGESKLPHRCKSMLYPDVEESSVFERRITDSEEELEVFAGELNNARKRTRTLEEAGYMEQPSSCGEEILKEVGDVNSRGTASEVSSGCNKSPTKEQCFGDEATAKDLQTDEGGEETQGEAGSDSRLDAVEISQGLLDFVNSALQSSSLTFTYDSRGNIRIEPDNARVLQTKEILIPKIREDCPYRKKRLATPNTSELSDYRPESSESGGYNTQGSMDLSSSSIEGGLDSNTPDYEHKQQTFAKPRSANSGHTSSKLSPESLLEGFQRTRFRSGGSFGSYDSAAKASGEDLSYASGGGSFQADATPGANRRSFPADSDSNDGVLIDQGRWLLKENHLIRKSPPEPMGMYGNIDSTSVDTAPDNASLESPRRYGTATTRSQRPLHDPLAVISSSEMEELAKPPTPKCTYYNLPHRSDSDPFLDDVSVKSVKSVKKDARRNEVRVSPTVDTSKTWSKKNGSMSSFASVEFKLPDSKVHPEQGSSVVVQAHSSSVAQRAAMQAQDSLESLHVRCGQYCPIL
ncbi:oxygen-regulated protein 1 [Aplochiton taeniatus]